VADSGVINIGVDSALRERSGGIARQNKSLKYLEDKLNSKRPSVENHSEAKKTYFEGVRFGVGLL
jgi:hypothetical protein